MSRGTRGLSKNPRDSPVEGEEEALATDVASAMYAMVKKAHVQHGASKVTSAKKPNHFRAACKSGARKAVGGGGHQPAKQELSKKSLGKFKAKVKFNAHAVEQKTVPSAKAVLSKMDKAVENSVTSEASKPLSKPAAQGNLVLKGGKQSSTALSKTCNVRSCDSIYNMGDSTLDQCHTDTNLSGQLCIMTDILVRAKANSRTHNIRVKVDPGTDANLMSIHHFRKTFPYLCDSNG